MAVVAKDRLTVDLDPGQRELLDRLAVNHGWSVGQCVRFIIADWFAQLQQAEETL